MNGTDRMVAWLREAMNAAEKIAQATTPVPKGKWVAVRDKHDADDAPLSLIQGQYEDEVDPDRQDYSSGMPVIAHAAEWQDEAEANLRHIALNDPAAVLRRIAADRKTLDLHTTPHTVVELAVEPVGELFCSECDGPCTHKGDAECVICGQDGCDTIRNLAEGYGWTEETT